MIYELIKMTADNTQPMASIQRLSLETNQPTGWILFTHIVKVQNTDITLQSTTLRALGVCVCVCVFRCVRECASTWWRRAWKLISLLVIFSLNLKHSALFCRIDYEGKCRKKMWIIEFSVWRCAVFFLKSFESIECARYANS